MTRNSHLRNSKDFDLKESYRAWNGEFGDSIVTHHNFSETFDKCEVCGEDMEDGDTAEMVDTSEFGEVGKVYMCHPDCGITNGFAVA